MVGCVGQAAADQCEAQRRGEREALISELRDSVCDLAGADQCAELGH